MVTEKDIETLISAAKQVNDIAKRLDSREEDCPSCHLTKYLNWEEHTAKVQLQAAAKKIRATALDLMPEKKEVKKNGSR